MEKAIVRFFDTGALSFERAKTLPLLTDEDVKKADRYNGEQDKVVHLVSTYLKKKYVGAWKTDDRGKPYSEKKLFNLSHTDGAVVYCESTRQIGVDVETIRPAEEDLVRYVCDDAEYAYCKDDGAFFEIWTAKESLLKCAGGGIDRAPKAAPALPLRGEKVLDGQTYYTDVKRYGDRIVAVAQKGATPFLTVVVPTDLFIGR